MEPDLLRFLNERGFREPEPIPFIHFLEADVEVVIKITSAKMLENSIEKMQNLTPIAIRTNL